MQNVNPQGKDCDDCVFRAIAGGTGISWKDTFAGLCQTGLSLHAMPDYPIVFRKYLKEIGAHYVYKSAQAHAHTEDEASTANMTAGVRTASSVPSPSPKAGPGKRLIRISAARPSLSVIIRSLRPSRHPTSAAIPWGLASISRMERRR